MWPSGQRVPCCLVVLLPILVSWCSARPATDHSLRYSAASGTAAAVVCPSRMALTVDIAGLRSPLTVQLAESSSEFLPPDAQPSDRTCFYQGSVAGDGGIAVAKQKNGLFSATFHYNGELYEIPEQAASGDRFTAILVPSPKEARTCGVSGKQLNPKQQRHHEHSQLSRSKRSVLLDTNSNVTQTDRKYLSLILVGDKYFYQKLSSNLTLSQSRLWEIGNYINALYKQLGVNVIIVHSEVWQTDPYVTYSATSPAGANSTEMLNNFLDYKMKAFSGRPHSAAHLVSGLKMTGSDVGLAHLGKLCNFALGGGVNSDRDPNPIGVAVTVAHELGHNLGLSHDEDEPGCFCPDSQGCIMAAIGSDINPLRFSNCSVFRYLDYSVDNGLGYCMSDPPTDANVAATRATCGNRIVEPGEDCDCGLPQWCNNTCCDPNTCKFASGATCASGQCCNLATCSVRPQGVVCRPRRRTCDLEEYCNGTSEWCPEFDDYMIDGSECLSGQAYCYKGRCSDRNSRCSLMFNATDFKAAPASYAVATIQGYQTGYCSYNQSEYNPLSYTYTACAPENMRCGLLYCTSNLAAGDPMPIWKGASLPDAKVFEGTINGTNVIAAFMQLDIRSSGYRDPGLVPDGAECGTGRMCVNSQCTAVNTTRCPNCNGNGFCAQSGLCFCNPGYKPPDCLQTGTGGSLNNHPPDTSTTTTTPTTTTTTTPTTPTTTTTTTTTPTTTVTTPTTTTTTTTATTPTTTTTTPTTTTTTPTTPTTTTTTTTPTNTATTPTTPTTITTTTQTTTTSTTIAATTTTSSTAATTPESTTAQVTSTPSTTTSTVSRPGPDILPSDATGQKCSLALALLCPLLAMLLPYS